MKQYLFFIIICLSSCTNNQHDTEDGLWSAMQKEDVLVFKHLDNGLEHLRSNDIKRFREEFDEYQKHHYASQVLYRLWFDEITKR